MKTTITLLLSLLLVGGVFAQKKDRSERREAASQLSVEQKVELQTKKMTLHLDLTQEQQNKVMVLAKKNLNEREAKKKEMMIAKAEGKKMTTDQRFEANSNRLDSQIAMKKEMKTILNADQYDKWEKSLGKRGRGMRQHKRDGDHKKR